MLIDRISNTKRLLILLGVITADIVLPPFLALVFETYLLFDFLNTFILIATVFALNKNRSYVIVSSLLAIPLLGAIWIGKVYGLIWPLVPGLFCGMLFFIYTAFNILQEVLTREKVTPEVIAGSIAVYLMLGFICSYFYGLLDILVPGSLMYTATGNPLNSYSYIYYSFITLTTLGYGDIVPVTPIAQCIALVEALVGQIYLVVLVAWLVGMYITEYRTGKKHPARLNK